MEQQSPSAFLEYWHYAMIVGAIILASMIQFDQFVNILNIICGGDRAAVFAGFAGLQGFEPAAPAVFGSAFDAGGHGFERAGI